MLFNFFFVGIWCANRAFSRCDRLIRPKINQENQYCAVCTELHSFFKSLVRGYSVFFLTRSMIKPSPSHPYPLLAQSQQTHPGLSNMKHISADLHCLTLLPMYLLNKSHSPMLFSPLCQHWFRLSSITQQSWRWPGTRWSPGLPDEYEPDYRAP